MHTRGDDPLTETRENGPGVGQAAKEVTDRVKSLVKLELELAKLEVTKKIASFGLGIGLLVGAGLFGLLLLGFLFATVAALLATFLSTWLALLIVTALLALIAGALALAGLSALRKGTPLPKQAIAEAKLTTEVLKSNGAH